MDSRLPPDASDLFEKGSRYAVDSGKVLAYGLNGTSNTAIEDICDQATETYARKVLNWPKGRLAKPDIFDVVNSQGPFHDIGECTKHFVQHLHDLFKMSPPKQVPTYPHAFCVISAEQARTTVNLVLAYKLHYQWQLQHCSIPVEVELGLSVESLRMGDTTARNILDKFGDNS